MSKPVMFFLSCLALLTATPAFATQQICRYVAPQNWMPGAEAEALGRALGVDVSFVQPDGGCWTVYGHKDGGKIEVYLNPETGNVVRTEHRS